MLPWKYQGNMGGTCSSLVDPNPIDKITDDAYVLEGGRVISKRERLPGMKGSPGYIVHKDRVWLPGRKCQTENVMSQIYVLSVLVLLIMSSFAAVNGFGILPIVLSFACISLLLLASTNPVTATLVAVTTLPAQFLASVIVDEP